MAEISKQKTRKPAGTAPRTFVSENFTRVHYAADGRPTTGAASEEQPKRVTAAAVKLTAPRPAQVRAVNEYVEAPFAAASTSAAAKVKHEPGPATVPSPDKTADIGRSEKRDEVPSIICDECAMCRCGECRTMPKFRQWTCCKYGGVSSAKAMIRTCTCASATDECWGAEGTAAEDHDATAAAERPQPMAPRGRGWLRFVLALVCAPCRLCFCALNAAHDEAERVYGRRTFRGCKCQRPLEQPQAAGHSPDRSVPAPSRPSTLSALASRARSFKPLRFVVPESPRRAMPKAPPTPPAKIYYSCTTPSFKSSAPTIMGRDH